MGIRQPGLFFTQMSADRNQNGRLHLMRQLEHSGCLPTCPYQRKPKRTPGSYRLYELQYGPSYQKKGFIENRKN
jgi:hypothetical protein